MSVILKTVYLNNLGKQQPKGPTNYPAAVEQFLTTFRAAEKSGPSIIVFLTDVLPLMHNGKWRNGYLAIEQSLDLAARAGLRGTVIHAVGVGGSYYDDVTPPTGFPPSPPPM